MLLLPFSAPLIKAKFLTRYKRFLVDVEFPNKDITTVHCANTGSMRSCCDINADVYLSTSLNLERKYKHSLELINLWDGLACVNTAQANSLIASLFKNHMLQTKFTFHGKEIFAQDFEGIATWKGEAKFNSQTRFDFLLRKESPFVQNNWLEVKSVSLYQEPLSKWSFPDAVTTRGQKHLQELMHATEQGDKAWLFFVLMRGSKIEPQKLVNNFTIAENIDAKYAELVRQALKSNVQIRIITTDITLEGISISQYAKFETGKL